MGGKDGDGKSLQISRRRYVSGSSTLGCVYDENDSARLERWRMHQDLIRYSTSLAILEKNQIRTTL